MLGQHAGVHFDEIIGPFQFEFALECSEIPHVGMAVRMRTNRHQARVGHLVDLRPAKSPGSVSQPDDVGRQVDGEGQVALKEYRVGVIEDSSVSVIEGQYEVPMAIRVTWIGNGVLEGYYSAVPNQPVDVTGKGGRSDLHLSAWVGLDIVVDEYARSRWHRKRQVRQGESRLGDPSNRGRGATIGSFAWARTTSGGGSTAIRHVRCL